MKSLKLSDLPEDVFQQRGKLFSFGIEERIKRSTDYIQNEYNEKEKLYRCSTFMDYVYLYAFAGDVNKHGDYPAIESHHQFDHSVKHALSGSYKAAFDNLRTCMELTLLTIYFSIEKDSIDSNEGNLQKYVQDLLKKLEREKEWLNSVNDTPFFSTMISKIKKVVRVNDFDRKFDWIKRLQNNYYGLCDVTHVKGIKNGLYSMNQINHRINNSSLHTTNLKTLESYLNLLTCTIENIAVLVSLYNHIVLVELPLEEKFGDNEPIGFVHPGQTKTINSVIPLDYQSYFDNLKQNDEEVLGKKHWVETRPSLTSEELKKQEEDFNSIFKNNKEN